MASRWGVECVFTYGIPAILTEKTRKADAAVWLQDFSGLSYTFEQSPYGIIIDSMSHSVEDLQEFLEHIKKINGWKRYKLMATVNVYL